MSDERKRILEKGWQKVAKGRGADAEKHFRKLVDASSQDAEAWHGLGVALQLQGKNAAAYQALRRSLDLDDARVEAWHALAQAADSQGYTLEALAAAQKAAQLAREQGYPPAVIEGLETTVHELQRMIRRLLRDFGLEEGEPGVEERLQQAFAAYRRGLNALREQRLPEAIAALRESLQHAPRNPRAWSNLGVAYLLDRQWEKAEEAFRRALDIDPSYEPARFNLEKLPQYRSEAEQSPLLHGFTQTKHGARERDALK